MNFCRKCLNLYLKSEDFLYQICLDQHILLSTVRTINSLTRLCNIPGYLARARERDGSTDPGWQGTFFATMLWPCTIGPAFLTRAALYVYATNSAACIRPDAMDLRLVYATCISPHANASAVSDSHRMRENQWLIDGVALPKYACYFNDSVALVNAA